MGKKSSLTTNFLYNTLYQILILILPLVTTPYISRVLGAENVGINSYCNAVSHVFMIVGMLGVKNYGNRSIAEKGDNRYERSKAFWSIYFFQLITSVIAVVIYSVYIFAFCDTDVEIAIIYIFYVVSAAFDISWLFFGLEKFKLTVIRNVVVRLIGVICTFIFVRDSGDLAIYSVIKVGTILLSFLVLFPFLRKEVDFVKPSLKDMKAHIIPNLVLFVPVIAINVYKYMDKIMLGAMTDKIQNGMYESTETILRVPNSIITAFGTVMMPRMSSLIAQNKEAKSNEYIRNSFVIISFLSCGMAFGLAAVAADFVPVFFGKGYDDCKVLIPLIAPTTIFVSWANVIRTQYLIPRKKDKSYIISVIIGAVVNFAFNLILIGRYGAKGAVIGTILAEASVCVIQSLVVRKDIGLGKPLAQSAPFLVFGAVMYLCLKLMANMLPLGGKLMIVIQVAVGIIIFSALSAIYLKAIHHPLFEKGLAKLNRK